jgi:hypothetical protein
MKWSFVATVALVACGSRSDLTAAPPTSPSRDAGQPVSTTGVFCKPGDAMKELASIDDAHFVSHLETDGAWIYEQLNDGIGTMSCDGGPMTMLMHGGVFLGEPWNDGVYVVGSDLEWMRHDGSGRHTVLPVVGFLAPPSMFVLGTPYNVDITEYSLEDGSSHELVAMASAFPFVNDRIAATDRYLHVVVEEGIDMDTFRFVDHRVDRVDGSLHDVDLFTEHAGYPFGCDMSDVAPNAACMGEFCALDERDDVVTLPVPHACVLSVDDEWAYYSLPAGFSRVGLRDGTVETLIPNANALYMAEANGCLYVEAVFDKPGAHIVRIPR